jgi:hypothetical protein
MRQFTPGFELPASVLEHLISARPVRRFVQTIFARENLSLLTSSPASADHFFVSRNPPTVQNQRFEVSYADSTICLWENIYF